jgi:hypothetical protein
VGQHRYGLDTQIRCPYQGNRWEKERKEGYGHRLPLFIPQIGVAVKLLSSLWFKKHKMWCNPPWEWVAESRWLIVLPTHPSRNPRPISRIQAYIA